MLSFIKVISYHLLAGNQIWIWAREKSIMFIVYYAMLHCSESPPVIYHYYVYTNAQYLPVMYNVYASVYMLCYEFNTI